LIRNVKNFYAEKPKLDSETEIKAMNSYERIQAAIDYIEGHLTEPIPLERAAEAACFSLPHLYRIFHALVGHSIKEYIRKRRLSEAAVRIVETSESLIQICFDYQFGSQESFTRAFQAMFGITPGRFRKVGGSEAAFPRVDVIGTYIAADDVNLLDPRIKVLKTLKPVKVACCRAYGELPEIDAWRTLMGWAGREGILEQSRGYRVFGFDNPGPKEGEKEHGYEFCLTLESQVKTSEKIRIKTLPGGLYAVTNTTVSEIGSAWDHFVKWLNISRYRHGSHQCLEEHLIVTEEPGEKTPIDLYLPVEQPQQLHGGKP
jgi:AraC family transcriptional regulator